MQIAMFNGWYFFWLALSAGAIVGLYYLLRNKSPFVQKSVLWGFLAFGLLLHFLKVYIPPYSVDEARMLRDSWLVNICGANIGLFPILFFCKNKHVKDYMFYIGVISGLLALVYPEEPMAKVNQAAEQLDIIRFYYHHWMVMAIPLLMALLGLYKPSYKGILNAPTGLLLVMLFIMLNQIFQSELGFIPLRDRNNFFGIDYKNTSYIWGPGTGVIGDILSTFTPKFFTIVPVGEYAGQMKYWPWFWIVVPAYVLVTPLAFGISMIFDHKNFARDVKNLKNRLFRKKEKTEVKS